ncbi:hypothetical protein V6N13_012938 [Hibiscus sabdariffa]|uniref:Uncharacterized protein n=1 Tax=Hibiscus sabdariffa TaxID=183260 RepID=A0ABR2SGU5_9ROSI
MAPRIGKQAGKNNSWKKVKKEELKVRRLKAELTNVKSYTASTLTALEELHLTITQIREMIRPLLPPDWFNAQLVAVLHAGNNGD